MSDRLSIQEVKELLSQCDDPAMIASLERDDRKGVQRLVRSWQRRRHRAAAEQAKAERLYAPIRTVRGQGYQRVAGIDEAGRGPLAGPVVAACVILADNPALPVDDSKKLSEHQRDILYDEILSTCLAYGVGRVEADEIDELNIYRAARKAMIMAVDSCRPLRPDFCFIDAMHLPELGVAQQSLVHGDSLCATISAASIIAKVTRDRIMREAARIYPHYGFERHKGYGAPEHLAALAAHGPCPIHRLSFAPVRDYVLPTVDFFETLLHRSTSIEALRSVGDRIKSASADLTDDELSYLRTSYRRRRDEIISGVRS